MLKDKRRKRHSEIKAKAQHCLSPCFSPTDDPRLQRPFISYIASVIASAILDKRTLYSRLRLVFRYRGIITRYLSIVLDIPARSRNVLIAGSTPACSISCRVHRCRFRHAGSLRGIESVLQIRRFRKSSISGAIPEGERKKRDSRAIQ